MSVSEPLPPAVVFFQLNDLYHIDAKADYTRPDSLLFPRLATLLVRAREHLQTIGVSSYLCVPGDFIAPSCLSKQTHGAHMIDLLNVLGTDFVTFGNHEFETFRAAGGTTLNRTLFDMMDRSEFKWIGTNFEFAPDARVDSLRNSGKLVPHVTLPLAAGHDLVLLGLLYPGDRNEFHGYGSSGDPIASARNTIAELDAAADRPARRSYIAMTHQYLDDDRQFAQTVRRTPLIMGGHDHSVVFQVSNSGGLIIKTKSNGGTIRVNWIVELTSDQVATAREAMRTTRRLTEIPLFKDLIGRLGLPLIRYILTGSSTRRGPALADIEDALREYLVESTDIQQHTGRGIPEPPSIGLFSSGNRHLAVFSQVFNPGGRRFFDLLPADPEVKRLVDSHLPGAGTEGRTIIDAPVEFVIQDNQVRRTGTNFGNLVADILLGRFSDDRARRCDVSLINSGSFRIDRNVQEGEPITRRTICDVFFHPNDLRRFVLRGEQLSLLLAHSAELRERNVTEGHGEFLQVGGLRIEVANGAVERIMHVSAAGRAVPLDPARVYSVATSGYVATRCREYRDFFNGQCGDPLEGDVEVAIANGLESLAHRLTARNAAAMLNRINRARWEWR